MISRRRRLKNIDLAYFITFFPLPFFLSLLEKFPMKWAKIVKNALFPHSSSDLLTCPAPAITFPFIPPPDLSTTPVFHPPLLNKEGKFRAETSYAAFLSQATSNSRFPSFGGGAGVVVLVRGGIKSQ